MRLCAGVSLALILVGCGSELPPAAGPARDTATLGDGRQVVLLGRRRIVQLHAGQRIASAPAGVGPAHIGCLAREWCYVTDKRGDALLVYRVGSGIELTRRYRVAGGPDAIAVDRRLHRLWVRLGSGRRVELIAHGRPHILRTP